jgi:hypothetical protein
MVMVLVLAACGTELKLSQTQLIQLQVTPPTASLAAGHSRQLIATAVYQDGHTEDISSQVTWSTLDTSTASVDTNGLVTTTAAGSTRVEASLQGQTAVADINVTAATLVSMELLPDLAGVPLGAAVTAVAQGRLSDGSILDLTSQAVWSTPLGGLTVETPGVARATTMGQARLCASYQGMQAFVDLDVTAAAAARLQVIAVRDLAALPRGAQAALAVVATFTDGTELDVTADAAWSIDDLVVALVESGTLRALELGNVQLTASYLGTEVSVPVTVTAAELVGLALSPPEATALLGSFIQLSALGYYSDGTVDDVTDQVTWSSMDPLVVQVSNVVADAGYAYGLVVDGQSVVTAEVPGTWLSATSLVHVSGP